jgi:hypothetical protein
MHTRTFDLLDKNEFSDMIILPKSILNEIPKKMRNKMEFLISKKSLIIEIKGVS